MLRKNVIGHISLRKKRNNRYETQIIIGERKYRDKGWGTKAIKLIVRKAKKLSIREIVLEIRPENARAIRVYEKCGFRKTGRKYYPKNKNLPKTIVMRYR